MLENEVLKEAALLIGNKGWTQGVFRTVKGKRCIEGAINDCAPAIEVAFAAQKKVQDYLKVTDLVAWNDNPERTSTEVINALLEARNA